MTLTHTDGVRLLWCAGASTEDVLAQLDHHAQGSTGLNGSNGTSASNGHGGPPDGTGPVRLGIVDPTERKLRLARRLVAKGSPWRGRSDIWFTPSGFVHRGGKIAFVFPGVEPTFGAEAVGLPALAHRFGLEPPAIEDDTIPHRSRSIYRMELFLDRILRRLGIEPQLVAGHSIGEWAGTVAAGVLPLDHAEELVSFVDIEAVELPDVDFAALAAGAEAVGAVLDAHAELRDVVISHDNCPAQSVICGPPAAVEHALARLREVNILGYVLDFQSGFHTPAIAPMIEGIRTLANGFPFGPAEVPMWSSTIVAPYPSTHDEIVDLHLRHLVEPVRFRPLVERLYHDAGARVFVQVGLGSLTGFINDTLSDTDHAYVPVLVGKRSALAQMHRVLTALWVEGVDLRPDALAAPPPDTAQSAKIAAAAPAAPSLKVPAAPSPAEEPALSAFPSAAAAPSPPAPAAPAAPPVTPAAPGTGAGPGAPAAMPAAAAPVASGHVDPLLAAADMLSQAAQASREVMDALAARLDLPPILRPGTPAVAQPGAPAAVPQAVPSPGPAPVAPAPTPAPVPAVADTPPLPPVPPGPAAGGGRPGKPWPVQAERFTRRFSLEDMPETLDHTLYLQPEDWPDVSDRFPIVAMTSQIAILREVVAEYAGGRDVVEVGVRNMRWFDLSEPTDVKIALAAENDDTVGMLFGDYCRAKVRVGSFPPAPRYERAPLGNERPTTHTAQDLWDLRLMFHGPRFQGVPSLGPIGDDGVLGTFVKLDTPGILLDNLGKLIAYMAIDKGGVGEGALPVGVDRIEFFGPTPPVGTEVFCDVRLVELQSDLVKANGVLVLPDGTVWCRVTGWASIVFHLDEHMEPIYHVPSRNYVTEPQAGDWSIVLERWPGGAARELTARRFLARSERETYQSLNLLEQRRWLLEVLAAKDVVRRWLRDTYDIGCFPVEATPVPDGERRYRVECRHIPAGHDLRVTVSVVERAVVAILGDGHYPDIEARLVDEDDTDADADDVARAAAEAAEAVEARNPGAEVDRSTGPFDLTPSRLNLAVPRLAVAWTRGTGAGSGSGDATAADQGRLAQPPSTGITAPVT